MFQPIPFVSYRFFTKLLFIHIFVIHRSTKEWSERMPQRCSNDHVSRLDPDPAVSLYPRRAPWTSVAFLMSANVLLCYSNHRIRASVKGGGHGFLRDQH